MNTININLEQNREFQFTEILQSSVYKIVGNVLLERPVNKEDEWKPAKLMIATILGQDAQYVDEKNTGENINEKDS